MGMEGLHGALTDSGTLLEGVNGSVCVGSSPLHGVPGFCSCFCLSRHNCYPCLPVMFTVVCTYGSIS